MREFLLDGWVWLIIIFFGGAFVWGIWRFILAWMDYRDSKKWNAMIKRLDDADKKNPVDIWKPSKRI